MVLLSVARVKATEEEDPVLADAIDRATGGDPQTMTQLLHWGLQHTDLDELHAKAEHLRTTQQLGGEGGGGEGDLTPGVLSASGNVGEAPPGLPSPDGTAAPRTVSPMSKERRVELDELARIMMPDMVAEMRKMLAVAEDETMDPEGRVLALEMLQEQVEDIDNARDFNTIGGFPVVLRALAEDGAPRLQAAAAWVAGTAVQNNRELQLALVAQGLLPALLRLVGAHAVPEVRAKALYAASGLLRACPEAQAQFTVHDGLAALLGALTDPSPKLVRKALVLLTDLLLESSQAEAEGAKGAEASPTATGDAGVPLSHEAWNEGRASMEADVGASLRGALRNSSRLCDAVVQSLQAEDLDTRDKASRALEQIFDAGLELLPSLGHGTVPGEGGEGSSCLGGAMRAALRAFAEVCEAAPDGCGDDDVLPRLLRLEARVAAPM